MCAAPLLGGNYIRGDYIQCYPRWFYCPFYEAILCAPVVDGQVDTCQLRGNKRTNPVESGLIPDTPEAIARACMAGPPKKPKDWRYASESGN